jgi:peptidoglycan/xylan/chitin deacetylase (PgdA/CDA1 family)
MPRRHWGAILNLAALAVALAGCFPAGVLQLAPGQIGEVQLPAATTAAPLPTSTAARPTSTLPPAPTATPPPTEAGRVVAGPPPATQPVPTDPPPTPAPTETPVGPTPDALAAGRWIHAPILMYHYVEPWPAGADELRQGLTVPPEAFAAQMAYLHERGYTTISLYELMEALAVGRPLPERPVVLTFDDGYRCLADYAAPIMHTYGFTGTIFLVTQLMDEGFPQYLTWPQAEALYALGWKLEPHTKTHAQLSGRGRDFQLYQMLGSLEAVEAHIGTRPRFFAYPSGQFDELTLQLARELNLWGGVSVAFGRDHNIQTAHTLARVRVSGHDSLAEFAAALEGRN